MNTIKNGKLFTEVTVEESATVSGGDSNLTQTFTYHGSNIDGVQIQQSSNSTPTNSSTSQPTKQNPSTSSQTPSNGPTFQILPFGSLVQTIS